MIEFPDGVFPRTATPALVDAGGVMRSPLNTAALRVNRLGSHYRVGLTFPPLESAQGRVVVSRLIRAQSEGLRVAYPLTEGQGVPGAPVVDGPGQTGRTINLRGLNAGYRAREGFWVSIANAAGQHFLHNVAGDVVADGSGRMALNLSELLRVPFSDGCQVFLAQPMIEGLVDGDARAWNLSLESLTSIEFVLEEAR